MNDNDSKEQHDPVRETLHQELLQVTGETPGGVSGSVIKGGRETEFDFAGARFHVVFVDPKGNKSIRRTGPKVAGYLAAIAGAVWFGRTIMDDWRKNIDLNDFVDDDDLAVTGTIRTVDGKEYPMTWDAVLGYVILGWTVGDTPVVLAGGRSLGHLIWMLEEAGRPFYDPEVAVLEIIQRSQQRQVVEVPPGAVQKILGADGQPPS